MSSHVTSHVTSPVFTAEPLVSVTYPNGIVPMEIAQFLLFYLDGLVNHVHRCQTGLQPGEQMVQSPLLSEAGPPPPGTPSYSSLFFKQVWMWTT